MRARLFSKVSTHLKFSIEQNKTPHDSMYDLFRNKFTLAEQFLSTLNEKADWRKTKHQLFIAKMQSKPVAFTGLEIGDGEIIQRYVGEYSEQVFYNKTCMLHTMEVLPDYQGYGLQMLLWEKLCEQAQNEGFNSIILNPKNEMAYRRFFNKFNIVPKEYMLSQVTCFGEYFDGDSTKKPLSGRSYCHFSNRTKCFCPIS